MNSAFTPSLTFRGARPSRAWVSASRRNNLCSAEVRESETLPPTPETGVLPIRHTAPVMATMLKRLYRYVVVIYVAERPGPCIIAPGHAEIFH